MKSVLTLADEPAGPYKSSPRLDAILSQLPKYSRAHVSNMLCNANVFTLADLCAKKRGDLLSYKNFGKKSLRDLEQTLATFGASLADLPPIRRVETLTQTPAQRIANPVWLRGQIQELIRSCADNIKDDLKLADQTYGDVSAQYHASVKSHRHWKRQLERILQGKTSAEVLRSVLAAEGLSP